MESIFDCFFETKLESLERCGLKTRQNRRDVIDHLNAVISGCCDGQDLAPEESCRLAILSAIKYHQRKKSENSTICMMGKFHNVLYVAMKICWDWGVKDSTTVCLLLEEIYVCERTFERLFLGAIFGTNAPHFIAGWKSDFRDQDENCRAMVYFLEHAAQSSLSFAVDCVETGSQIRMRFVDVPMESCGNASPARVCLQAYAPDILLILLRYGANPLSHGDGGSNPIIALLDKLIECQDRRYPYQLESCLKILIRAVPRVELPYKPLLFAARREMFAEKYGILIQDGLLRSENVFGIPDLKALSRFAIREQLRINSKLPFGIKQLRIPRVLKRYVDLMETD